VSVSFWHWWILAGLCLLVEALTPGFIFLWLGISAGMTGLVALLLPGLVWQWELLVFTAFSLASVPIWLRLRRRGSTEGSGLNRRAEACIGQLGILDGSLAQGRHGRVRLGDTTWSAIGPDLPAGARVRVVGADGNVLQVEPTAAADP
jgi:membrane protein implicated in regulation of membrane protease activity